MWLPSYFFVFVCAIRWVEICGICVDSKKNVSITENCVFCEKKSRDGHEKLKCHNSILAPTTCQIGTRCVEEDPCHASCEIVTRASCIEEDDGKSLSFYDGCLFCEKNANTLRRCRGHYSDEIQKCSDMEVCINVDCRNSKCESKVKLAPFDEKCDGVMFDGYCWKQCPNNTSINADNSTSDCISDYECTRLGGSIYAYQDFKYCSSLRWNQTFTGKLKQANDRVFDSKCQRSLDSDVEDFVAPSKLWFDDLKHEYCNNRYCMRIWDEGKRLVSDWLKINFSATIPVKAECSSCSKREVNISKSAAEVFGLTIGDLREYQYSFVECQKCDANKSAVIPCAPTSHNSFIKSCRTALHSEMCIESSDCTASCEKLNVPPVGCRLKFSGICVSECPRNTVIKLDSKNDTCIKAWDCRKQDGELFPTRVPKYCRFRTSLPPSKGVYFGMAGASILFLIVLSMMVLYVCRIKKTYVPKDIDLPIEQYDKLADSQNNSNLIIISKEYIKKLGDQELGRGAFGVVYKGELCLNPHEKAPKKYYIAIKELNVAEMRTPSNRFIQAQIEEMMEEAKIMSRMDHPNVLPLYGICIADQNLKIITPFRRHGSLETFLTNNKGRLSGRLLLQFCQQIASAMTYLSFKNIVHGDLATRNVLIATDTIPRNSSKDFEFSHLVAQVSDFGLALLSNRSQKAKFLPLPWAAIESLQAMLHKSEVYLNEQTDIWSYGITMWEIFTHASKPLDAYLEGVQNVKNPTNYSSFSQEIQEVMYYARLRIIERDYDQIDSREAEKNDEIRGNVMEVLHEHLINGERLPQPVTCTGDLYNVMLQCWNENPINRKSFAYFEHKFEDIVQQPEEYVTHIDISDNLFVQSPQNRADRVGLDRVGASTMSYFEKPPLISHESSTQTTSAGTGHLTNSGNSYINYDSINNHP